MEGSDMRDGISTERLLARVISETLPRLLARVRELEARVAALEAPAAAKRRRHHKNLGTWRALTALLEGGMTVHAAADRLGLATSTAYDYARMSPGQVRFLEERAAVEAEVGLRRRELLDGAPGGDGDGDGDGDGGLDWGRTFPDGSSGARPLDDGILRATLAVEAEFDDRGPA
jgi:hypothetical protein